MTRKDYIRSAARVAEIPNVETRVATAKVLAELFSVNNPRFDKRKFFAACRIPFDHQAIMALEGE